MKIFGIILLPLLLAFWLCLIGCIRDTNRMGWDFISAGLLIGLFWFLCLFTVMVVGAFQCLP